MRTAPLPILSTILFASALLIASPPSLVATSASAQTASGGAPPADSSNPNAVRGTVTGLSAPIVTHQVVPVHSDQARAAQFSGSVLVSLIVNAQGLPINVHVVRGVGMGLDEKAVEAVKQYRFKPAMRNGKPVPVVLNVQVNFQILDKKKDADKARQPVDAPAANDQKSTPAPAAEPSTK